MGYRSAVAYTIRFVPPISGDENKDNVNHETKMRESFYTFLAEAKVNNDTALCFVEEEPINAKEPNGEGFFIDEKNLQINFLAWHVKWYEHYKDVMCHENLFSLAREWANNDENTNDYIGGAFVRIGEEVNDNDMMYFGTGDSEWLDIGRTIYKDGKEL
jgi:hypothetical protein